mgnify:FL=1
MHYELIYIHRKLAKRNLQRLGPNKASMIQCKSHFIIFSYYRAIG